MKLGPVVINCDKLMVLSCPSVFVVRGREGGREERRGWK